MQSRVAGARRVLTVYGFPSRQNTRSAAVNKPIADFPLRAVLMYVTIPYFYEYTIKRYFPP